MDAFRNSDHHTKISNTVLLSLTREFALASLSTRTNSENIYSVEGLSYHWRGKRKGERERTSLMTSGKKKRGGNGFAE